MLGGLCDSNELLGRADDLAPSVVPVPTSARRELVSLRHTARGGEFLTRVGTSALALQPLRNPGYAIAERRRGGSDNANAATFRWVPMGNGSIAIEAFDRPRRFVAADASGALRLQTVAITRGERPPCFVRHEQPDGTVLLESASQPGAFVTKGEGANGRLRVVPRTPSATPPVAFTVAPSAAEYPPVSFWAEAHSGRVVLMWPLNEIIDETYTVYFRFCRAPEGCPIGRPKRRSAVWRDAAGFLTQGTGADLFERRVSIVDAKRLCREDSRCTSYTARCGVDCATSTALHDVYFKSYDAPEEALGQSLEWRSFFLIAEEAKLGADAATSDGGEAECEYQPPPKRCSRQKVPGAAWQHERDRYLIQGRGYDLFQKHVHSVDEALEICASDERCTSLTMRCVSAECSIEPNGIEVFFKAFVVAKDHLDNGKGWHSYYVPTEETCSRRESK